MNPLKYFDKKYFGLTVLLIVMTGLLGYANSFRAPFHFDDQLVIVENYLIKSLNHLDWLFYYDPSRFLTHLSFALNFHFGRLDVAGYHTVNFILHIGIAVLIYVLMHCTVSLAGGLRRYSAQDIQLILLFAVLIFTVHPLQTQAVTYIAQRATLLASLFYVGSLLLYIFSRSKDDFHLYAAAAAMMLLGIFTKPIIATLPLALILYEVCFLHFRKDFRDGTSRASWQDRMKVLLGLVPFFLMALMVPLFIMAWKFKAIDAARYLDITRETQSLTRPEYLFTQFNVLMTYGRLLFFPVHQSLDYAYPISRSFFSFPTWLSFSVLAAVLGMGVYFFRRQRLIAFCIFWMAVVLSLESSIFPIADVINEHRMYLALAGFALLLSFALRHFLKPREVYMGVMIVIVAALTLLTFQRNIVWGDRVGMLLDIAAKAPEKPRIFNNLGIAYAAREQWEESEKAYLRAIELNPDYAHPRNNLANVYFKLGRLDESEAQLKKAVEIEPDYAGAYYNLGNLAWARGQAEEAQQYYAESIRLSPSFVLALVAYAKTCRFLKDYQRSEFILYLAQSIDPTHESVYINLGDLYLTVGEYEMALRQFQIALRYTDQPAVLLNNIGNIYDIFRDYEQAELMYKEAMWRDPSYAHSYFNLANTMRKTGEFIQAREFLEKAISLYTLQNNPEMARKAHERLVQLGPAGP